MKQITEVEKNRASEWFVSLRNDIVSAFEELEKSHFKGPFSELNAGKFEVNETKREDKPGVDAGGGLMRWLSVWEFLKCERIQNFGLVVLV